MIRAKIAATRLTTDSAASDSRPTDPVSAHATVWSAIVISAAAIDSYMSRTSRCCVAALSAAAVTATMVTVLLAAHRGPAMPLQQDARAHVAGATARTATVAGRRSAR